MGRTAHEAVDQRLRISTGQEKMVRMNGMAQTIGAALDMLKQPPGASLLIAGLGIGFSLAQASADPRPGQICVVERERAVIDWHTKGTQPLRRFAGGGHDDPRTRIVHDDLLQHLRTASEQYDVLCLDIDNGPGGTCQPE